MSARGVPAQDTYPEGYQLVPVQELLHLAPEAPAERPKPSKRGTKLKPLPVEAKEEDAGE